MKDVYRLGDTAQEVVDSLQALKQEKSVRLFKSAIEDFYRFDNHGVYLLDPDQPWYVISDLDVWIKRAQRAVDKIIDSVAEKLSS